MIRHSLKEDVDVEAADARADRCVGSNIEKTSDFLSVYKETLNMLCL